MTKKQQIKIDKKVALEYLLEYKLEDAAALLNTSVENLQSIVLDKKDKWQKPHINKNATIDELNPKVNEFIERNYNKLYNKYVKNKNNTIFFQNDEDVFHNSLIKLCAEFSNPTDADLIKRFEKIYNTNKWELNKRNSQIRIKEKVMKSEYLNDNTSDNANN